MSYINVVFKTSDTNRTCLQLPVNFTYEDFVGVAERLYGAGCCQVLTFVAGSKNIHVHDRTQFDKSREFIKNHCQIWTAQKMMGGCFLRDTFILLSDGTRKNISDVQVGDSLLAFTTFGEIVTTSIQEVFVHDVDEYIKLSAGDSLLCVTREHPFFVGNDSFCSLEKLHINDCIYSLVDGRLQSMSIMSMVTIVAPTTRVYNLRTAEPHTYFANGFAVHNKFGAEFVDLSNISGLKRLEWSPSGPTWYTAKPGLCLEGQCTNTSCEAHKCEKYKRTVIINLGFRQFDLLADANADTAKCPACARYVEPKTCAFNRCKWRWQGIKQAQSGMPPENISADWKVADNAYHRFDQDVSGTVIWRKLIIETQEN
ncbi:unnamed protein product [Rotaria socialis]|uniref:Hint domain-containing protein n=1 Tax=Rotaria socialis TaxID=392032 RepID=A0A820GFG0_9BILA|nr:unnamed protein product [Rotaria socialis]CAF3429650.1 unnamed protein product [Rotaria socialis]CAF3593425.1 unnamed protein product [Rotaria socialis]CAF3604368.1 unnamed protein product [Rotaria socialis]CAF3624060.1 unnamed protein product [Rotaria socialis]